MIRKTLYALIAISSLLMGSVAAQSLPNFDNESLNQLRKFNQFYQYLNGLYVEDIDNQMLVEEAIKATLAKLDPHSVYVSVEEMKSVEESFSGSFSGIGIEFNVLNDTIIVVNALSGGPAQNVGLTAGDRIIKVDDKNVVGTTRAGVPKLLRGDKGSKVKITLLRQGNPSPLDFIITRDDIPIETVDAAYKVDNNTGYIKINRFANNTFSEFVEAYNSLGKIDGLILDLRNNGGGLLDQAILLTNFFLPKGATIVSTEGRALAPETVKAQYNGQDLDGKVVVLINESSASASEIVSGAIQDWDRGVIIGRRSFGKGLVQRQIPLSDGSAVRVTVAHYHTPTGRVIQRPYKNGEQEQYYQDLADRINSGSDTVARTEQAEQYKTLVKGRTVYGGGGIYPDIYVKVDTSGYSKEWARIINQGVLNEYIIGYVDKNRQELEHEYANFKKFKTSFDVDDSMLELLYKMAEDKKIEVNRENIKVSEDIIRVQIKALIAQKLWSTNEYFIISNEGLGEQSYDKAVEVMKNWDKYAQFTM